MFHRDWRGWLREGLVQISSRGAILVLLTGLAILGLLSDGWQAAQRLWHELHRPVAVYRRPISHGLAISLNGLERQLQPGGLLPGIDIQGALFDRMENDWILFGHSAPERPGLPRDAVAIALRALRLHLDAPGIDIQPQHGDTGAAQAMQDARYFGGIAGSVVGHWFFRFDYWMKRTSLGYEPAAVPGLPVYWHRVVEAFERESITHGLTGVARWTRRTRYWLCTGAFAAIEGNDTLTFEHTPLVVLAERLPDRGDMAPHPASPCASRGTDDPLAAEFAHWLTEHLHEVAQVVPVTEIEDFARIMASVTWLMDRDPYRDVRPWLQAPLARAETPATVPTLAQQAVREQTVHQHGRLVSYQYRLEVSGGVIMAPVLQRFRVGDNSLRLLHRTVLAARPADRPAMWHFIFSPPST